MPKTRWSSRAAFLARVPERQATAKSRRHRAQPLFGRQAEVRAQRRLPDLVVLALVGPLAMAILAGELRQDGTVRRLAWADLGRVHSLLEARGVTAAEFPTYVERLHHTNTARVREGDLDHLIFYLLQSTRFTGDPPLEPALSAKTLMESLDEPERGRFLIDPRSTRPQIPESVLSRAAALVRVLHDPGPDRRLLFFRQLMESAVPDRARWLDFLMGEYLRVMRFVYQKEFVAQPSGSREAVTDLYRVRGLSTDTSVEAGYLVYLGLGMLRSLDPDRPIRRVLLVGPGLDLAPRTGLADERPPESYQPWAVIDALLQLGLARAESLQVVAADINPRVVAHLRLARAQPPVLTLIPEIGGVEGVTLSDDYRDYFTRLGRALGDVESHRPRGSGSSQAIGKLVRVRPGPAATLRAERLDIVTERLEEQFDLAIATNILPYFDDIQLMLAMSSIAGMLAPGGVFLHNEGRPVVGEITDALGLPFEHARHAIIATVRGAPAPLGDSVWLHRKAGAPHPRR